MAQTGRHDLTERGQGAGRVLGDRGVGGRGLERDGQGDGLAVVEQHGRHMGAGVQAVSAGRSFDGRDPVAEFTQPVDVAAHGARGDVETPGEILAGPVTVRLQQREQCEQSGGRLVHEIHPARSTGHNLSATSARVTYVFVT